MILKIKKWNSFFKERFNLIQIIPMVVVFVWAHFNLLNSVLDWKFLFLVLITVLFFLKLRLYDEIKDFKSDIKIHPERPLPSGRFKINEFKIIIFLIIFLEILFFSFFGLRQLFWILIVILYSLLMYKEFFVSNWIRKFLTFYAVTHTFIVFLFSLSIFIVLNQNLNKEMFFFSISSWFIFSLFEFGRKTFAKREEKKDIDSYSKNFTLFGALILNLITGFFGLYFLTLSKIEFKFFGIILFLILLILSLLFLWKDKFSKIFRFFTTFIIFLIYLLFILC